ncbi:hypothetical protein DFH09DRAFT_170576 [Mycena vulgaris]|nr:hypothetical protein DFH09DRAFT_170576 [Mycena vulgaris]
MIPAGSPLIGIQNRFETSSTTMFNIQELVDYCVDFLHDSRADLRACAQVCRACVHPAQYHLFRKMIHFNSIVDRYIRDSHLLDLVSNSPHVLGLVSRLEIHLHYLQTEAVLAAVPLLISLKEVRISGVYMPEMPTTTLVAVRALVGLPTVQRVELYCTLRGVESFLQIWNGCSAGIRHLALGSLGVYDEKYDWAAAPAGKAPKLRLDSLHLAPTCSVIPWLASDACPFDYSRLTALCVHEQLHVLRWPALAASAATITRLEFAPNSTHGPLELAPFTRLEQLSMRVHEYPDLHMIVGTLASLPAANRVPAIKIGIDCDFAWISVNQLARFDNELARLPPACLIAVEVEVDARAHDMSFENFVAAVERALPKLRQRGLLRVV